MVKSETDLAVNLPRPEVEESRVVEPGTGNPEPPNNAIPSANNEVAEPNPPSHDDDDKKLGESCSTMQLTADKMATTPKTTSPAPPTTAGGPQNLHHSPGSASTSSSSSSSSSNTGYTRQSNPRPRAHKHSTGSATGNGNGPIISSLPPSAISAAPYIPTSMVHQPVGVDYHHGGHNHPPPLHHIHHLHHPVHIAPTYAYLPCPDGGPPHTTGPPPHGIPPPPLNPASGTAWISPYYPGPIYDSSGIPTFVHHVTPPTPSATTANNSGNTNSSSGAKSTNNRMSPAPQHLVQHPAASSAPTFCHNHSPAAVSLAGSPVSSCPNSSGLQQQPPQQQHVVSYHLQQGEVISLQLGDGQVEVIQGRTKKHHFSLIEIYLGNEFSII